MMDATLPPDFHHAAEPDVCEIAGCPTGSAMARHIDHLTDQLGTQRARADRLDAELAAANTMITVHTCGPDCRKTPRCAEVADLRAEVEEAREEFRLERNETLALKNALAERSAEAEALRASNQSVAVCSAHTAEITQGDCVICELEEAADRELRLTAEVEALRARIHEAIEVYAGMEGVPVPETACEGYLLRIINQMVAELSGWEEEA